MSTIEAASILDRIATASIGKKGISGEGDDVVAHVDTTAAGLTAIIVADGIGSHAFARDGAQFAVDAAKEYIQQSQGIENLLPVFKRAHEHVITQGTPLLQKVEGGRSPETTCGTTLIIALESHDKFHFGYIGNGAIWHFRESPLKKQSDRRHFTWAAINYLNPHIVEVDGKDKLYRYLSVDKEVERSRPTLMTLDKDTNGGDIIIECHERLTVVNRLVATNGIGRDFPKKLLRSGDIALIRAG